MRKDKPAAIAVKQAKEPVRHRVVEAKLPSELWPACQSVSRHVRDIHNTCVHFARTAISCFDWDKASGKSIQKADTNLPLGGKEILAAYAKAIPILNARRIKEKGTDAKLLPALDATNPKPTSTILDPTLFDSVVRVWPDGLDPQGRPAFSRLPTFLANHAVQQVRGEFSTWLASVKAYGKAGPGSGAGLPAMPGYLPKGKLPAFGMSLVHPNYCRKLPRLLPERDMRLGEDKLGILSKADADAFGDFPLGDYIARTLIQRHKDKAKDFIAKQIRFIPRHDGVRIQIIAETPDVHPEGSFLYELAKREPEAWAKNRGDNALMQDWIRNLCEAQTWNTDSMDSANLNAWITGGFEALGIDPGLSNIAAVSCSSGSRSRVFSARKIEEKLSSFDDRIDAFVAAHTPSRVKEQDAKKARDNYLPLNERIERRTLLKELHHSPALLKLRQKRDDYATEILHKLTSQLAGHAKREKAAIVFFSRNKGWKTDAGLGKKMNRRSHRLSHNKFAELLRYKLWEIGIMLLETEESYTSQSSFVDGDPLPVHPKGAMQMATDAKRAKAKGAKEANAKPAKVLAQTVKATKQASHEGAGKDHHQQQHQPQQQPKQQPKQQPQQCAAAPETFSGTRGESGNQRHWFSRHRPSDSPAKKKHNSQPNRHNRHRRQRVHADGQAALNAIRKACPGFACTPKVSLGHEVWILVRGSWRPWSPWAKGQDASLLGG